LSNARAMEKLALQAGCSPVVGLMGESVLRHARRPAIRSRTAAAALGQKIEAIEGIVPARHKPRRAVCRDRTDAAAHRGPRHFCSWLLRITLAKTGAA
jgi:hypothetical protein